MSRDNLCSFTGRPIDELTMERVRAGELTMEDFRIRAETLGKQADTAESAGYRQLARNLRMAAELTCLSNEEVLNIYRELRPGRADFQTLSALAERLENEHKAHLTAAFIRDAAQVCRKRKIIR